MIEKDISSLAPQYQQLIQRLMPDDETPLIICCDPSSSKMFYVVTKNRAIEITDANKKSPSTRTTRLENIASINESRTFAIISLGGNGSVLMGFIFGEQNESYYKFLKILQDAWEKTKNIQMSRTISPSERLQEINNLLASKLITETEYKQKREEILRDL